MQKTLGRLCLVLLPIGVVVAAGCSSPPDEKLCAGHTQAALSVCATGPVVKGVDVSTYQGQVNWSAAKGAGIAFAFARVSDGLTHIDNEFARNWPALKAAGIVRGVYQFFRPGEDPVQQADLVLAHLQQAGGLQTGDLPVVMDMEVTDGVAAATIQANMHAWLDRIEQATGRKPLIYTAAFMSTAVGDGFTAYPLWVANYGVSCPTMPANFTHWRFWQSSSTGSVAGISGGVDVDEWNGTLAELQAFAGGVTSPDAGVPHDAGASHDAGTSHDPGSGSDAGHALGDGNDAGARGTAPDAAPPAANPCL